jgi:hypothetical protein
MMKTTGLATLLIFIAALSSAQAQSAPKCHAGTSYFVIEDEADNDFGGQKFLVKAKASPDAKIPCVYKVDKGDYEFDVSGDAFYFLGLQGRFLVLDAGTASMRSLIVHDLIARKNVFETTTSGENTQVSEQGVTFWMLTDEGTPKNCKKYKEYAKQGLGAAIETRSTFDFASLEARKSNQTHCIATQ